MPENSRAATNMPHPTSAKAAGSETAETQIKNTNRGGASPEDSSKTQTALDKTTAGVFNRTSAGLKTADAAKISNAKIPAASKTGKTTADRKTSKIQTGARI